MSYREEITRLTAALKDLLVHGGAVPVADVHAALTGHASLVLFMQQVHSDLNGWSELPSQDIRELELRPVSLLKRLVRQQPTMTDGTFLATLQAQITSPAGQLWREVAKASTIATWEWSRIAAVALPTGATAWSEIADLASLAEATSILELDVADSLALAARLTDARSFRTSARSGVRLVAAEVRRLAETGPLPIGPDIKSPTNTTLIVGLGSTDVPEALARLDAILHAAAEVTPIQVLHVFERVRKLSYPAAILGSARRQEVKSDRPGASERRMGSS